MTGNHSALSYNSQVLDKFTEICNPSFANDCIKSFRYFRVFDNNLYINLSTNHEWLAERLTKIPNNGKSFHKPLCESVENKFLFYLWENDKADELVNLFIKHNIFNGITAYRRNGNSVEAWSFGSTMENSLAPNFYINNLNFLKSFIESFNNSAKEIIDCSDSSKLARFSEEVLITPPVREEKAILQSEASTTRIGEKSTLTRREFECLKLLSFGKTYKETAKAMQLSPRTIESYLVLIKRKLNLDCKSKIIDHYWRNLSNYEF